MEKPAVSRRGEVLGVHGAGHSSWGVRTTRNSRLLPFARLKGERMRRDGLSIGLTFTYVHNSIFLHELCAFLYRRLGRGARFATLCGIVVVAFACVCVVCSLVRHWGCRMRMRLRGLQPCATNLEAIDNRCDTKWLVESPQLFAWPLFPPESCRIRMRLRGLQLCAALGLSHSHAFAGFACRCNNPRRRRLASAMQKGW